MASGTRAKLAEEFAKYGLELVDFFINAITPPEEVQKAIDARSAMGAVGDLNAFMKFQAANSMAKLAEQGGGAGGMGAGAMGMGMGAGFGMMMPGMIQQAMAAGAQPAARTTPAGGAAAGVSLGPDFSKLAAAPTDPVALVRTVAGSAGYQVAEQAGALLVTVPVGPLRKQVVHVELGAKDPSGNAVVNYWSVCGPYDETKAADLLRYNTGTLNGAFAVKKVGAVGDGRPANQPTRRIDRRLGRQPRALGARLAGRSGRAKNGRRRRELRGQYRIAAASLRRIALHREQNRIHLLRLRNGASFKLRPRPNRRYNE